MKKEKKTRTGKEKAIIAVSVILTAAIILTVLLSNFLVSFALDTDSSVNMNSVMSMVLQQNGEEGGTMAYSGFTGTEEEKQWFNDNSENIYVTSEDGLKLHARHIRNENGNGNYVIIFHGYTMHGGHMAHSSKHFYELGYSIIVPDARAHGESEGRYIGMGWPERRDALCWINSALETSPDAKIVLYGISMGASTVMNVSGEEDIPANVKVAIEDCGYTSVWDEFKGQLNSLFHLPSFPLLNTAAVIAKYRVGYDLTLADSKAQIENSKLPTLFIHGSDDVFVPFEMHDVLYNAAGCEKEKLVIEGAGHAMSSTINPDLYWSTVDAFVEKHIN